MFPIVIFVLKTGLASVNWSKYNTKNEAEMKAIN